MNGHWSWGGWSMLSRLCFSSFLEPTWSVCLRGRQRQWCCWGCYWWGGKEFVEETIVKELQINQDLHCWKRAVRKQHLSWRGQFPSLKHQTPKTKNQKPLFHQGVSQSCGREPLLQTKRGPSDRPEVQCCWIDPKDDTSYLCHHFPWILVRTCGTMSRNHPSSRCDKGGRKSILILCITGRILATLAVFLSYMLEHLVSPFTWFSHSMPKYYLGCGMALAGHHLWAVRGGVRVVPRRLRHHCRRDHRGDSHHQDPHHLRALAHRHRTCQLCDRVYPSGGDQKVSFFVILKFFLQYFKFLGVMAVSVACHLASLAYVAFAMEEKKQESKVKIRDIFSFSSFLEGFSVVFRKRESGMRRVVVATVLICCLCQFAWGVR